MPNSKQIVYLSQAQYAELIANGSITVDGVTVTYDENDIYVTPQAEPVTDMRMNGTSIAANGVANIPIGNNKLGVVKIGATAYGLQILNDGEVRIIRSSDNDLKAGASGTVSLAPNVQHKSTFYGLAKAAGDTTQSQSNNPVGTYTDEAKSAIQTMLDVPSNSDVTTAIGSAIGNIHQFEVQVVQTLPAENIQEHTVYFVPKTGETNDVYDEYIYINNTWEMIGNTQIDLSGYVQSSELANVATSGDYDDLTNKPTIPEVPVQDVQVDSVSVVQNGVANVPTGSNTNLGVVKGSNVYGVTVWGGTTAGQLATVPATANQIKAGNQQYAPITPTSQDQSVFYGLAKAAGADEKDSTLSVGTYTETAKSAIRNMLGAASTNVIAVQDTQPTNTDTKVWLPETQAAGVEVPTMEDMNTALAGKVSDVQVNGTSVVSGGVANVPVAGNNTLGVVRVSDDDYGIGFYGDGRIVTKGATSAQIKSGNNGYKPITPSTQNYSVFYGLAKAAGDTTQTVSDNAVGTYTADASAAIRSMIGAVGDVQVNGTSVVSSGVANIPIAGNGINGVVQVSGNQGLGMSQVTPGLLVIGAASSSAIKSASHAYAPIVPVRQHESTFYGLAKAAGDTSQSASSNAVGTYTTEAKSAIQSMLGIDLQSIASEVEIPLIETVSGTTPSITGQPNTRYVCGEVSTLSITPPSAGSIDIIFDSGSTPAVITVPNTVRWPAWFDATALEADTTYEILITDGVYGSVMTWAT